MGLRFVVYSAESPYQIFYDFCPFLGRVRGVQLFQEFFQLVIVGFERLELIGILPQIFEHRQGPVIAFMDESFDFWKL